MGQLEVAAVAAVKVEPPRRMRVSCSQFASCRWSGYRIVSVLGKQLAPCPQCGKDVVA